MNELERQKDAKEDDKAEATTSRLAAAFCSLANFLKTHVNVARECVLTAFSLEPTRERLNNIEEFARNSGFKVLDTGQEWKCKLHPPVIPSDEITWICSECGDWMCKPQLNLPKINMTLNEALQTSVLGISEALCDDLVVCLSNPRYQILSWFLPWDDLHRLCIMYLQDPQTTKNFVTELKFVDIDYSIFKGIKKEPVDDLAGIERGYEQYLDHDFVSGEESSSDSEDSMSQDSRPYSLGSDGAGENFYIPLIPVQQKSDPNTLKSLRMFRHNLKRKDKEPADSVPEKIQKQEPSSTVTSNSYRGHSETSSLSHFLNGVPQDSTQSMLPPQDPDSKNVKTATLPLLGGQVAKNEIKSIQVHLQSLNTQKALENTKTPTDQALKPYNQSASNNISDILKKELTVRLLNKPLLSGSKENNAHNLNSSSNSKIPLSSQFQDIKTYTRTVQKNNKEVKFSQKPPDPIVVNKQLLLTSNNRQEKSSPKVSQEKTSVVQVPVALKQLPLLESTVKPLAITQKLQSTPPILNSCQRTQPVDIKYQKRCFKSQETTPPVQSKFNQVSKLSLLKEKDPSWRKPVIVEVQIQNSSCHIDQAPIVKNIQNNLKSMLDPPEMSLNLLETVDLTSTPDRLSPNSIDLTLSPNTMIPHGNQAVVDLTLTSQSPKTQQINQDIVDLTLVKPEPDLNSLVKNSTMPVHILAAALARAKEYQENQEIAESILQATAIPFTLPPPLSKNTANLRPIPSQSQNNPINKTSESKSQQIDQEKKSQRPTKKVKTADKAVNTCQELYQVQKRYLEKVRAFRARKSQEQARTSVLKQDVSTSPHLKNQEVQSMTSSLTLGQQEQVVRRDPSPSICSLRSDQIQPQLALKEKQWPNCARKFSHLKVIEKTQINPINKQLNLQNVVPVIGIPNQSQNPKQLREPETLFQNAHSEQAQKNMMRNPEKLSTNCSLNSLKLTMQTKFQKVFPISFQNLKTSEVINLKEIEINSSKTSPPTQTQTNTNKLVFSNKEELSISKPIQFQNQTNQNESLEKIKQVQEILLPGSQVAPTIVPPKNQHHSEVKFQNCPILPLDQSKSQSERESQQAKSLILSSNKLPNFHVPAKSHKLVQQESRQFKNHPFDLDKPQHCHTLNLNLFKSQCNNLDQLSELINQKQSDKSKVLEETAIQKQSVDETQGNLNHQQVQLKQELISQSFTQKQAMNVESKKDLSATNTSNLLTKPVDSLVRITPQAQQETTKLSQQQNTARNQNRLQNDSCNLLKVHSLFHSSEKQLLPHSLIQEPNSTVPLTVQSTPKESHQLVHSSPKTSPLVQYSTEKPLLVQLSTGQKSPLVQLPPLIPFLTETVPTDPEVQKSPMLEVCQYKYQLDIPLSPLQELSSLQNKSEQVSKLANLITPQIPEMKVILKQNNFNQKSSISFQEVLQKKTFYSSLETANKTIFPIVKENVETPNASNENMLKFMKSEEKTDFERDLAEMFGEEVNQWKNGVDITDNGLFFDLSDFVEDEMPLNNNDYSVILKADEVKDVPEYLPKNSNLTDNIRTYAKKCKIEKDCVKQLLKYEIFDTCKNVNSSLSFMPHSNVQSDQVKGKELKVVLCRLPSSVNPRKKKLLSKEEYSTRQKCDRGKTPPKNSKRRRSIDKSENKTGRMSNTGQNHITSPLQDINPRVTPKTTPSSCCDFSKSSRLTDTFSSDKKSVDRKKGKDTISCNKKIYTRSVFANIPGLNNFEMIQPSNVNQIVNVVQVSGGRVTQNVSIQNSQTSTQVTPHIQRIGQPRIPETKVEHSTTTTATTTTVSTVVTATTKTATTSQPSALINILSHQGMRPVTTQPNVVRRAPMINILSQQIIRPIQVPKTTANTVVVSENNQVS